MGNKHHRNSQMSDPLWSDRQIEILKSMRDNLSCDDRDLLNKTMIGSLPFEYIGHVCELLNGEFLMNGINEHFEATPYGKEVEAILDIVNRPRLTVD